MEFKDPIQNWIDAVTYLTSRGFDVTDSRLMYSPSKQFGRMNRRVIIPFTYKNEVVGYTARWIGTSSKEVAKYYNQQLKQILYMGLIGKQEIEKWL